MPKISSMSKRLIETEFPIQKVSQESAREKNIRHGHISTLHIYWARRPLAASRTTALAALLPDNPQKRPAWERLIVRLAPWEAVANGNARQQLREARQAIRDAFPEHPPRVLDPFAGGGSIPLEALRLGCETHALDYNPLAVLLNLATLHYPLQFGRSLVEAVRVAGEWVLQEARKELAAFYPPDPDGSLPVGYLWARTLPCQNPTCGAEIPLMRQFWLARKEKRQIALKPVPNQSEKRVEFIIVGQAGEPLGFDPEQGTVRRANVECPLCQSVIDDDTTRALFREGKASQRMVAVVLHHPQQTGKRYRLPTERDLEAYQRAAQALPAKRAQLQQRWDIDPVPDEPLPPKGTLGFAPHWSAPKVWGDLFNARQLLALITFAEKVREASEHDWNGHNHPTQLPLDTKPTPQTPTHPELRKAVATYLAIVIDELARFTSVLNPWKVDAEAIVHVFGRQAIPMMWDYVENVPIGTHGGTWEHRMDEILKVISSITQMAESLREEAYDR